MRSFEALSQRKPGSLPLAVVAILLSAGASSRGETITYETGKGLSPGDLDTRVTMLIGPANLPFPTAFTPADFQAAQNGPHPLVVDPANGGYPTPGSPWSNPFEGNFPTPLGTTGGWYLAASGAEDPYLNGADPNLTNQGGHTALFCLEFEITEPIECAQFTLYGLGDNGLGYDPSGTLEDLPPNLGAYNEGLWINEMPVPNTVLARYGDFYTPEPDDDPIDDTVGFKISRDITSYLHLGTNRIYLYNTDIHTHGSITFNFSIVTNEPMGIGSPPTIVAPVTCGGSLNATAGVPLTFTVCATDPDAGDVVELQLTSLLPPGAVLDTSAAIGNPACITVTYTAPHTQVTPVEFAFSAEDSTCEPAECSFSVGVSECFVLLGQAAANLSLGNGDHLYVQPVALIPVMVSPLVVPLPNHPWAVGLEFFTQAVMYSPFPGAFGGDPLKTSNGLRTKIGVECASYGFASGMLLTTQSEPQLGGAMVFQFGMTP